MAPRSRQGEATDDGALRRARALAAPTRVAMLELLRGAEGPLTAQQLGAALGVHHTAVRQHAAVLAEAGLLRATVLPPEGRGRPRLGYTAVDDPDPYRQLAGMLAEAVRERRTPREVGQRHGAEVTPSPEGPLATLKAEADRLGFQPVVRARGKGRHDVVLQACPFAEVAADDPATVCALHQGLAEGIAERAGGLEVEALHVADPRHGGCRLTVRETGAAT